MKPYHEVWTRGMRCLALAVVAVVLGSALLPKRWLYRHGRPNRVARLLNRGWAMAHAAGLWPSRWVTLQVPGRRTGRTTSFPLAVADYQGERYLVAMLGEGSSWVRNVRAAGGRVVLRHGRREAVRLEEVDPDARPPILRRYLSVAPGARPHIPVGRHAPVEDFEPIAARFPVFRVTTDQPAPEPAGRQRERPTFAGGSALDRPAGPRQVWCPPA